MVPPICDFGWNAPDFRLADADGTMVALADVRGANGTLVMFICNHWSLRARGRRPHRPRRP